jgi:hypothetical protein
LYNRTDAAASTWRASNKARFPTNFVVMFRIDSSSDA